jgi:hypothetical protein
MTKTSNGVKVNGSKWKILVKHALFLYIFTLVAVIIKAFIQVNGFPISNIWQALALAVLPLIYLIVARFFIGVYAAFKRFNFDACGQFLVYVWWGYVCFVLYRLFFGGPI